MKNPLHNELEELWYISISSVDPYDIPESVVIYFKNNSEVNKKMSIETIHGTQLDLQNQNPTIVLENYKATFCLGSTPYIPTVTIDPIDDILDPEYPRKITFTGTVSRTDDYIPDAILVEYVGITMRASLIDDTHWTVTFDLEEVVKDTDQVVSAKANSIDVNNPEMEGEFSSPVEETFKILITIPEEPECDPVTDKISCLCLDITKNYKVTVDGQSITGTFEEVVTFLDSHGLYAYPSETTCNPAPPEIDGEESQELENFDYAVIRYKWDAEDGKDLDTRTQIISPLIEDRVGWRVGWGVSGTDGNYLTWGGDNMDSGVEAVLLDLKLLKQENPNHTDIFNIALRAFWYYSVDLGNITLELETYLGGEMVADEDGYDFINVGGSLVQNIQVEHEIFIQKSADIAGQTIGYVRYDKANDKTYLIKQDYVYSPITVKYIYPDNYSIRTIPTVFMFDDYGSHVFEFTTSDQHKTKESISHNEDFSDDLYYAVTYSDGSEVKYGDPINAKSIMPDGDTIDFYSAMMPMVTYSALSREFYITTGGHNDLRLTISLDDETDTVLADLTVSELPRKAEDYVYAINKNPLLTNGVSFKYTYTFTGYDNNVYTYINSILHEKYIEFDDEQLTKIVYDKGSTREFFARVKRIEQGEVTALYYFPDHSSTVRKQTLTVISDTYNPYIPYYMYEHSYNLYRYQNNDINNTVHLLFVDSNMNVITMDELYFNNISGITQIGTGISRIAAAGGINAYSFMVKPEYVPDNIPSTLRHFNIFKPTFGDDSYRQAGALNKVADWDIENITSLYGAFKDCTTMNVDLSGWNTVNVRNLSGAFSNCPLLDTDISNWDVQKVLNANNMFYGATLMQQHDYSTWYMPYAYHNMSSLNISDSRLPKKSNHPDTPYVVENNQIVITRSDNTETLVYAGDAKDRYLDIHGYRWLTMNTDLTTDKSFNLTYDKESHATLFQLSSDRSSPSVRLSARYSSLVLSHFPTIPEINNVSFKYHSGHCFYPEYLPENITSLHGLMHRGTAGQVGGVVLPSLWDTSHVTDMSHMFGTKEPLMYKDLMMRKWNVSNITERPDGFSGVSLEGEHPSDPVWGTSGKGGELTFYTIHDSYSFYVAKFGAPMDSSDLLNVSAKWVSGDISNPASAAMGSDSLRVGRFDISACQLITEPTDRLAQVMGINNKDEWYFYKRDVTRWGWDSSGEDYINIVSSDNSNIKLRF